MASFKNISGEDLTIPGTGVVKAGETVELGDGFHNANFEPVGEKKRTRRDTSDALENKTADEA